MKSTYLYHSIREDINNLSSINFSHITGTIKKNYWNHNLHFSFPVCKINVFMRGDFSVCVDNNIFSPIYGDVCFLMPNQKHFGIVPKDTEVNYFELGVGQNALDDVPGGKTLFETILSQIQCKKEFIRPTKHDANNLIACCHQIEARLDQQNLMLAYMEIIRFFDILSHIYTNPLKINPNILSYNCSMVVKYIEENFGNKITIANLAKVCGVSEEWLSRCFKAEIGITIHDFIINYRMCVAVSMLDHKPLSEIAYTCGFADTSHFISHFKRHYGVTPLQYIKKIHIKH